MKDNTFYENLFAAKKEIGKISKDSTNPFFKSKYFDINSLLEHVEPVLAKYGLMVIQPIEEDCVVTKIIDEKGFGVASAMKMTMLADPQKMGSQVSYYRRYTLSSLLALQATDDDSNLATKQVKQEAKPTIEVGNKGWDNVMKGIEDGKVKSVADVKKYFNMSKITEKALLIALKL